MSIVSTKWLSKNHSKVKILDSSWHMPNLNRNSLKEYNKEHIENAIFFDMHDPTTLNSQGPDIGTQYRSEIFFINDKQKKIAEEIKLIFDKKYNGKVKTNISKEINYCKAEDYHQKYIQKRN